MEFSLSKTIVAFFAFALVCVCANPLPHVIGGGLNTDFSLSFRPAPRSTPQWLLSAVSELRHSISRGAESQNTGSTARSGINKVPEAIISASGTRTPASSPVLVENHRDLSDANPFLRNKRQADECPLADNLPEMIQELNSHLNATQYLALNPTHANYVNQTTDSSLTCANNATWWPKTKINLKSNCPWRLFERDLGTNAFPRYLIDAQCICERCIGMTTMGCEEIRKEVTVLRRQGCKDGVAIMNAEKINVTVGCACVGTPQQPATTQAPPPQPGSDGGPPATE